MSALHRARQLQPGSTVRWDRLERDAFSAHPEVLAGPKSGSSGPPKPREWLLLAPLGLLAAVVAGAPIWGYVAIAADGSRFATAAPDSDPSVTIAVAGSFYACALVVVLSHIVIWLRNGRPKARMDLGYLGITAVLGAMTTLSVWRRGTAGGVETWDRWIIPVVLATVVSGVHACVLLVIKLRHEASSALSLEGSDALDARTARAAELDDAEQATIRADLDAAIADLERRGIITTAVAARARSLDLGALALTMMSRNRGTGSARLP
ncbi:hypothetical protein [Aeromicrobium duanguangcaii]|uniref:hypothetical protein n=1 Tax=Aeromicrobium duanguangcaii TaxID=2968086 RepID=UPI002017E16B|nr:hypothetical protein [Aeromicrobium duanguangcaii]MCL3836491.1 hypothetical protein [Aeromicrobium duanguangcaii]